MKSILVYICAVNVNTYYHNGVLYYHACTSVILYYEYTRPKITETGVVESKMTAYTVCYLSTVTLTSIVALKGL